jgi:chromate reductase
VLITTLDYTGSVPGLLKNAIDWASSPYPDHVLRGTPVIVAGASISAYGATLAQAELRRVLKSIGADVLEVELPVGHAQEACSADGRLADGRLADAQLRLQLASMVRNLLACTA